MSRAPSTAQVAFEAKSAPPASMPSGAELDTLFRQYPSLKPELQRIYQSTREPDDGSSTGLPVSAGRAALRGPWKPERGFDNGLKSLKSALERDDEAAAGIAAFIKLLSEKIDPQS